MRRRVSIKKAKNTDFTLFLAFFKQITGIEPASPAWEASILPMNYICMTIIIIPFFLKCNPFNKFCMKRMIVYYLCKKT